VVQPALQDEPRCSRDVLGPNLAENRPETGKSEYRVANEPLSLKMNARVPENKFSYYINTKLWVGSGTPGPGRVDSGTPRPEGALTHLEEPGGVDSGSPGPDLRRSPGPGGSGEPRV
jgi:hypothetical protein